MWPWALNLFPYFIILCFSLITAMSSTTDSTTSITTSPVSPSSDDNELSACPSSASIQVVGMCRGDTVEGRNLFLETSFHSDEFTECSCDFRIVGADNGSLDIYPTTIDRTNCKAGISIADLRYNLNCNSGQNHASANLNSTQALKVSISGRGVAKYCLNFKTNDADVAILLNCSSSAVAGNTIAPLPTSAASAQTTLLTSFSPSTSLTLSTATPTTTYFPVFSTPTVIPSSSMKAKTALPETEHVITSRQTSSVSAIEPTKTTAPETNVVVTARPTSTVSAVAPIKTTTSETDVVVVSSQTSSVLASAPATTTQIASLSTLRPSTNPPETTVSLLMTTKEMSTKSSSTQLSPTTETTASVTVTSFTTLAPATSENTPTSENNTTPGAKSPGSSFPVVGLVVGLLAGILLVLAITGIILCYRLRHQKTYEVDEEEIAASIVSPESSTLHIQVLNPIYCDDPDMKSLSSYDSRPPDNMSTVSSFVSEEHSIPEPSVKDADPELNQDHTEMMETLVTKPSRDCSKRMTYCSPGGRKGSTQGLYRL